MRNTKKLNEFVNLLVNTYKLKIVDFCYLDKVIIHDAKYHYDWDITNLELQYIKSALKMLLYKKEIEKNENTPGSKLYK